MTTATAGIFTINYTLRTRADPGTDIQFGMDFTVTQSGVALPLTQLIFPATAVGTNKAGVWNVDNHKPPSPDPNCLIFAGADSGVITDKPTELSKRNKGVLTTKFAVYRVDVAGKVVQASGVTFGYQIDTDAAQPVTVFTGFKTISIPKEQQSVVSAQCKTVTFR